MPHLPSPITANLPPYAVELAARTLSAGKIVIYAGAGISVSAPTDLPTGAALARTIHASLGALFSIPSPVNPADLVAVADLVATFSGGEAALLETSARAAHFRTAKPGYVHKVLAHLMLEGVIDVLTTNWDNCIERGSGEEHLPTVVTDRDLVDILPPSVLKIHGCASRPSSLLVTSSHLENPPSWVRDQTRARLGSALVVFVGIGDVAGYVETRIEEAINEVGAIDNIRVVSPGVASRWDTSQWKNVAPTLRDEYKIPATADEFAEKFAAAYIVARLSEHQAGLAAEPSLSADFAGARIGLCQSEPLSILRWARQTDINPRAGETILKSPALGRVLTALGHMAGDSARLGNTQIFVTPEGPVELLISTETATTRRLVEVATYRLHEHVNQGVPAPRFIVAGGVGPIPKSTALPGSVMGDSHESDIIDGPFAQLPVVVHADEVIAS